MGSVPGVVITPANGFGTTRNFITNTMHVKLRTSEEFHNLYSLQNVIRMIKWVGHVERMERPQLHGVNKLVGWLVGWLGRYLVS